MAKGEPRTEDEAQETKRFLERGAPTSLEPIRRVSSPRAKVLPTRPVSVEIVDAAEALEELTEPQGGGSGEPTSENIAILELEFQPTTVVPEYSLSVFVDKRDANFRTGPEDPAFAGSIAFFCHAELRDGQLVCVAHNEEPAVFRLPLKSDALKTRGRAPLLVTLLPVPLEGRAPRQTLDVTATLEVVRSEYVPPG